MKKLFLVISVITICVWISSKKHSGFDASNNAIEISKEQASVSANSTTLSSDSYDKKTIPTPPLVRPSLVQNNPTQDLPIVEATPAPKELSHVISSYASIEDNRLIWMFVGFTSKKEAGKEILVDYTYLQDDCSTPTANWSTINTLEGPVTVDELGQWKSRIASQNFDIQTCHKIALRAHLAGETEYSNYVITSEIP